MSTENLRLAMAHRRTGVLFLSALLIGTGPLTGCSVPNGGAPGVPTASVPSSYASSVSNCLLGATSAAVEVAWAGNAPCESWITNLAGTGLVWQEIASIDPSLSVSCSLDGDGGTLTVYDEGSQMYGQDICSSEEQNGWMPDAGAEQSAAQSQASAQASLAAASAQAFAQAATASEAANVPQADAQVNADAQQMETDLATYNADVQAAKTALALAQGEPACQNGSGDQQTYDNAQTAYDDGATVYDDENALADGVNSSASDVQTLETDLAAAGESSDPALQRVNKDLATINSIGPVQNTESTALQNGASQVQNNTNNCG